MRDQFWPVDVVARPRRHPFAVAHKFHLALEDVERFVLETVHMVRRGKTWRHRPALGHGEGPVRRFAAGPQQRRRAKKTERLILSRVDEGLEPGRDHIVLLWMGSNSF